ncbi:MAG: ABC transporter permease [Acidimicrobiia bacterium]|nr:ABC transporter permease [Acidimicrobiia bacterium]
MIIATGVLEAFREVFTVAALASVVAAATPLVFATIGETISERSGVINLSLEGSIMLSAMVGFAAASTTDSALIGFLAAAAIGAAIALLIAFASIELRLDQIAVGFVLTLLAIDLSDFLGNSFVGIAGPQVPAWDIPGLESIPFFGEVFFQHNISVYASYLVIMVATWFIFRTRKGLELQGIGERPEGAFSRGVPVNKMRYVYVLIGGALVGIAGAAFSLDQIAGWRDNATRNFGWIALAIVIFGGWHPVRVAMGAYLFGLLQVVALKLQPVFPDFSQVLPSVPFPLMIFALVVVYSAWFRRFGDEHPRWRNILAADPPSGIGVAFHRE